MYIYLIRLGLVAAALMLIPQMATAQSCNPAAIYYLVRDVNGAPLTAQALGVMAESLPKNIGDARVSTGEISFKEDRQHYHWFDSIDWSKGTKVAALEFANASTCTMNLGEVELKYQGMKMRLMFDVKIERNQSDRRIVIDSLPFKSGSYKLNLEGWSHDPETMIPSDRWKRQ